MLRADQKHIYEDHLITRSFQAQGMFCSLLIICDLDALYQSTFFCTLCNTYQSQSTSP